MSCLFPSHDLCERATTSSSDIRTLFYVSGANNGPSGSHTGSGIFGVQQATQLGSPVHGDPLLRTTASYGFYNPVGSQQVFEITTSSIDNEAFNLSGTPCIMKVPRFTQVIP